MFRPFRTILPAVILTVGCGAAHADLVAGNAAPGSPNVSSQGFSRAETELLPEDESMHCVSIDRLHNYAYFGTFGLNFPGRVIKVAMGEGTDPPVRIGEIGLTGMNCQASAIDAAGTYGFFATNESQVIDKVLLGAGNLYPALTSSMTFDVSAVHSGLSAGVLCMAQDGAKNYLFCGLQHGLIIKLKLGAGDAPPTQLDVVRIDDEAHLVNLCSIDTANNYGYFATTNNSPSGSPKIYKVKLGNGDASMSIVGTPLTFSAAEVLASGAIDGARGYGYFTGKNAVYKIGLGGGDASPTMVNSLPFTAPRGVYDVAAGYAYVRALNASSTRTLFKVAFGDGDSTMSIVNSLDLTSILGSSDVADIDPTRGQILYGDLTFLRFMKISTGPGIGAPAPISSAAIPTSTFAPIQAGVFDSTNGYLYYVTANLPGKVIKMSPGTGRKRAKVVSTTDLNDEYGMDTAVVDTTHGYAYFAGHLPNPSFVVKVRMTPGEAAPVRVGSLVFDSADEAGLKNGLIDTQHGYAYFVSSHDSVVKVFLGAGDNLPQRIGSLAPEQSERLECGVIDPANEYAYFGGYKVENNAYVGEVLKVALGDGDALPTRVGVLALNAVELFPECAIIDTAQQQAYFSAGDGTSYNLIKIALGAGTALPTRVNSVAAGPKIDCGVIDPALHVGYFADNNDPATLYKYALGTGSNAPSQVAAIPLNPDEGPINNVVLDSAHGFAYFITYSARFTGLLFDYNGEKVIKVAVSETNQGYLRGYRFNLPHGAVVNSIHFYSHAAAGHVRLSLYDNSEPKKLLWQSGSITNTAANSELVVPVGDGTPSHLSLAAGEYWAAWEVDVSSPVASFTQGDEGDGFSALIDFGPAPATLAAADAAVTSDQWTEYIRYDDSIENGWSLY